MIHVEQYQNLWIPAIFQARRWGGGESEVGLRPNCVKVNVLCLERYSFLKIQA